jgi:uncharacterized protein YjbJ (UPF0337 family)
MNRLQMKGEWNDIKGRAKSAWGELTDDDLAKVEGDRDRLIGAIQKRYGLAQEEAERQVDRWIGTH